MDRSPARAGAGRSAILGFCPAYRPIADRLEHLLACFAAVIRSFLWIKGCRAPAPLCHSSPNSAKGEIACTVAI